MPSQLLCVTLGGARERAIREQFDELNVGREYGEEPFELTFSRGVQAKKLRSIEGLQSEVGDVLEDLGWQNARLTSELTTLTAGCDDEEVRVLACSFAHLRAMHRASSIGAVVLEDNVRFVQASAHREARELQAALQILLKQSEEARHGARVEVAEAPPLEATATAAVVGLLYWGYMGRADDLVTAHSSNTNSVVGSGNTAALVPFPPGNVPLWGCYAYAPLPAGWNALRSYLMTRGPSALFEEKRRKKAGNDSSSGTGSATKSNGKGNGVSSSGSGRRVALPIDRLLPRRVRAAGLGLWRAERPLAFRMPPPHPTQAIISPPGPPNSILPAPAAAAGADPSKEAAEVSTKLVIESAAMASAIHPHLDLRFYAATTLQLQLTGRLQEAGTGHNSLADIAAQKINDHTSLAEWSCLWLLPGEKASVALFQQDQHRRVATIPGAHWLLRPRHINRGTNNGSSSSDSSGSNSSASHSGSNKCNDLDRSDGIDYWREDDSTAVAAAGNARTVIAQAIKSLHFHGTEVEKLVNAVLAAVFVVGDRLGKLFPDAPANQVALLEAARWLAACSREATTSAHCDNSSSSSSSTHSNTSTSNCTITSVDPTSAVADRVKATAERGLCFVLRLLARAGAFADADEVLSLLPSPGNTTPIIAINVDCNSNSNVGEDSHAKNEDDVDSSDTASSAEVNVRSSAIAIQLLSAPQQLVAWRHAAEALDMSLDDSVKNDPDARAFSISPSSVVLTDPVVGSFLRQFASDLAESAASMEHLAPSSSPDDDGTMVKTSSEVFQEVAEMKNDDTAVLEERLAWCSVTRCDLDCVLLKLLEARIGAQGGLQIRSDNSNTIQSNGSGALSTLQASLTVRGALHDWFLGLSALAAHGPAVLLLPQVDEDSTSPRLQSLPARTSSSLMSCCPHVGPDLKTLCTTVAFLCNQGLASDAHWLLATLGPALSGPSHPLPNSNLVSSSPHVTNRCRSPLVQALSCTGDPAEVLRSLLVGACACGDASAAAWALRDGGVWAEEKSSSSSSSGQGGGLVAYGPLPLRVARAVMKHIGRCCGNSDSNSGDDNNGSGAGSNDDGNDSGDSKLDNSSRSSDNSVALLSIACEILDAVALTLPSRQPHAKSTEESTASPLDSTTIPAAPAALAAERLATVLFDSAIASGALDAAALATRWRRMLLLAATSATPNIAPVVAVPTGFVEGDVKVGTETETTSLDKGATAAAALTGGAAAQWGSPEWSAKVDEAMGLLAACVGAHEHWVDADQAVCSLVHGTPQRRSGTFAILPTDPEPRSSSSLGTIKDDGDTNSKDFKTAEHSRSDVEQHYIRPPQWLIAAWPPQTAAPGAWRPLHDPQSLSREDSEKDVVKLVDENETPLTELCSIAAAGCLQWLPLPLARLLVRDCYAKPQSWRRGSGGGVKLLGKRAAWLRRVVYFCCASPLKLPDLVTNDNPAALRIDGDHPHSLHDPASRDRELGTEDLISSLDAGVPRRLEVPWLSSFACGFRWVSAFAEVRGADDARMLEDDITNGLRCLVAYVATKIREKGGHQSSIHEDSTSSRSITILERREGAVAALELILGALSSAVALDLCSVKSGDKLLALALRALETTVNQESSSSSTLDSTTEGGIENAQDIVTECRIALEDRAARFLMASLALYSSAETETSSVDSSNETDTHMAHDWNGGNLHEVTTSPKDGGSCGVESLHHSASTLSFGFGAPLPLLLLATLARHFRLFESKATEEATTPPALLPNSEVTTTPTTSSSLISARCEKLRAAYAAALASSLRHAATESLNDTFTRAAVKATAKDRFTSAGQVFKSTMESSNTQTFAWRVDPPVLGLGAAEPLFTAHGAWLRDAVGCEPCFAAGFALLVAAAPPHSPQALKKCVASGANSSSSWNEALIAWAQSPQPIEALAAAVPKSIINDNAKERTTAAAAAVTKLQQSVKAALYNLAKELEGVVK